MLGRESHPTTLHVLALRPARGALTVVATHIMMLVVETKQKAELILTFLCKKPMACCLRFCSVIGTSICSSRYKPHWNVRPIPDMFETSSMSPIAPHQPSDLKDRPAAINNFAMTELSLFLLFFHCDASINDATLWRRQKGYAIGLMDNATRCGQCHRDTEMQTKMRLSEVWDRNLDLRLRRHKQLTTQMPIQRRQRRPLHPWRAEQTKQDVKMPNVSRRSTLIPYISALTCTCVMWHCRWCERVCVGSQADCTCTPTESHVHCTP